MMSKDTKQLIIIGSGGHARVVVDAVKEAGYYLLGIIDTDYKGQEESVFGCQVIGNSDTLSNFNPAETAVVIAFGNNQKRADYSRRVCELGFITPVIIHPTAIISKQTSIGTGAFVNTGAIINAGVEISGNTIINSGAIIEHEAIIGRNCHICPGVKIGGRTKVGDNTVVGIGSSIIDHITIGNDVSIGAGSVIIRDVKPGSTVIGVPGKSVK